MSAGQKKNGKSLLENLSENSGLAIVITDGKSKPIEGENNNSMCRALYSSEEFAPRCDAYCGRAFDWANEAGKPVSYQCHAGLNCMAVPLKSGEESFAVIVGRTFTKAAEYRAATEKAVDGEWRVFNPTEFFENVLLTASPKSLERLANRLGRLSDEEKRELLQTVDKDFAARETSIDEMAQRAEEFAKTEADEIAKLVEEFHQKTKLTAKEYEKIARRNRAEAEEAAAWRSLFGSLLQLGYRQACGLILDFLRKRYGLTSMLWLENAENRLEIVSAAGELKRRQIQIGVSADDERLLEAARTGKPLELRERREQDSEGEPQTINLFPLIIGGEVRSALIVGDYLESKKEKRRLARFCRTIASDLEILRLREELSRRNRIARTVHKLSESLKRIDAEDFWQNLTQISAELLRAERASLLIYNEKADSWQARALVGVVNDLSDDQTIGERVARKVWQMGAPMVVARIEETAIAPAPPEWQYKTDSFLSFPIMIGERKIAVLNFTDRADRTEFGNHDLELLQTIAPQVAVAVDHALIKDRAFEYERLSITDFLTGLLNKLYLESRLTEEINRSKRHRFPLSLMMIDVDFFKSYNDEFGHVEGDKALKIVGEKLKESLRAVDVAARYGGEEFSIILPQTTIEEAETIAERVRSRIENTDFPNRKLTVSIGIADCSPEVDCEKDLINLADKALYEAKRKGRNNVQIYGNFENSQGE
ncbi:MAG TPA: diguanylate cyclase [Pyrinomonadaceae bacterium]|jgi:diguanylate cyclase (GGDEF)-like protein